MKKTLSLPAIALLGTSLCLGIAHAQTTDNTMDNGAMNNGTMTNSMNDGAMTTGMMDKSMKTSDADQQFLMETAQGSVYDQATSELAVQKAQSKSVQRYALRLMDDHNRLNKMLFIQANKRGLVLPLTLSGDDQNNLQTLMGNNAGQDFDVAYLQEAVKINADDVRKANAALNASSDKDFRSLMNEYSATEQKHLNEASAILAGLQKNSPAMKGNMMNGTTMNGTTTTPAMNGTTPGMTQ